jgi:hypothetical protein
MKQATTGRPYGQERTLEIEGGNTSSYSVDNWLWERL